uniref:Uncharacterized protein n=1 Tax=Panagrolaimus sp. JU765 TaxID=591449 RepID=A0AC34Q5Z9_9BILA
MDNVDPKILDLTRRHIESNEQIKNDAYFSRLPEIVEAYKLLQKDSEETTTRESSRKPDWEINVVACNDLVGQSLCPKTQLNIGNHRVELTAEKVSELRYTVAQLLHRLEHYN